MEKITTLTHLNQVIQQLHSGQLPESSEEVRVYEKSYEHVGNTRLVMVKDTQTKWILAAGEGELYDALEGTAIENYGKVCPLSHENRLVLNKFFPYTKPKAFGLKHATMGLGDRLGLASPGHIDVFRDLDAKPVLAQQSIRELTLTQRSITDVLDAASFAVFQEGYKDGFGFDGDHLKEEKDIAMAISAGITMLTLDCSDYIPTGLEAKSSDEIIREYNKLPEDVRKDYESRYLNQTFSVNGLEITFDQDKLARNVLTYHEALNFVVHVYNEYVLKAEQEIDFELSIDESETVTSPEAHFFVANELKNKKVTVISLAPRFVGEFQKGIDYIGDVEQFEKDFIEHAQIAKHFGYKLSIHSGSDKFTVFPIIAKHTDGLFHIKTAGTNWLEAIRVIARVNPDLYRRMHSYSFEAFEDAKQYYHITPDLESISPLETVDDEHLPEYMNHDHCRQLFHVTYGHFLTAKDEQGNYLFRDEFFETLHKYEDEYRKAIVEHIGKHTNLLGF